jgi:hypothetical protein
MDFSADKRLVTAASEPDPGVVETHIPRRVSRALLAWLRVRKTEQGYALDWLPLLSSGAWVSAPILAGYALLFLVALVRFPLVGPVATVDEQLIYYQTARNFVQYGFLNSGFLHDLSTSSNPAHHPYIYSHMPAGPEVFIALLMKVVGERWALIRLVFAAIFFVGTVYFLRFVRLVLERHGLTGAGYALLFLSPFTVLHAIDHPAYSAFPLFLFFPVIALQRYYSTGRVVHYLMALVTVLVASVYAVTLDFILFCVAWCLLWLLGLMPLKFRHVAAMMLVGAVGIALHLLQGMWFLGPGIFFEELRITLLNRIFGEYSTPQVVTFYRTHDIVLHGNHFDLFRSLVSMNTALRFPARLPFVLAGLVGLGCGMLRIGRFDQASRTLLVPVDAASESFRTKMSLLAKLLVWAALSIIIPMALFPAYTGDYGLQGLGEFLLAVGAVAVLACTTQELFAEGRKLWPTRISGEVWIGGLALAVGTFVLLGALMMLVRTQQIGVEAMVRYHLGMDSSAGPQGAEGLGIRRALPEIERFSKGRIVMTNVYPTTAGFFTREAALGGCEMAAFGSDGSVDPGKCHAVFIKGYGGGVRVSPSHAVLFRGLFTGFTRCLADCLEELETRLDQHHDKIFETKLFTIYALKGN